MDEGALSQLIKMVGGCINHPTTSATTPTVPAVPKQLQATMNIPRAASTRAHTSPRQVPTVPTTSRAPVPLVPFRNLPAATSQYDMIQMYFMQQLMQQKMYSNFLNMHALMDHSTQSLIAQSNRPTENRASAAVESKSDPLMSLYEMVKPGSAPVSAALSGTSTPKPEEEVQGGGRSPSWKKLSLPARVNNFSIEGLLQLSGSDASKSSDAARRHRGGVNKSRIAQRKKHIEFHRRMKGINSKSKMAQCQTCGQLVNNNSSDITAHVYSHSDSKLFACSYCRQEFKQKADLYVHNKLSHSKENPDAITDLRDMGALCDVLDKCFPRSCKLAIETLIQNLVSSSKDEPYLACQVCQAHVPLLTSTIKSHLNEHPKFKCKQCPVVDTAEAVMITHSKEHHGSGTAYNISTSTSVLSTVLIECFSDYLTTGELELANDLAASNSPISNVSVE